MDYKKAELLAKSWVDIISEGAFAIVPAATITKPYGWVFFYQSKAFLETNEYQHALAGNAPILVNRITDEIIATGTANTIDKYLTDYEMKIPPAWLQMHPERPR